MESIRVAASIIKRMSTFRCRFIEQSGSYRTTTFTTRVKLYQVKQKLLAFYFSSHTTFYTYYIKTDGDSFNPQKNMYRSLGEKLFLKIS